MQTLDFTLNHALPHLKENAGQVYTTKTDFSFVQIKSFKKSILNPLHFCILSHASQNPEFVLLVFYVVNLCLIVK